MKTAWAIFWENLRSTEILTEQGVYFLPGNLQKIERTIRIIFSNGLNQPIEEKIRGIKKGRNPKIHFDSRGAMVTAFHPNHDHVALLAFKINDLEIVKNEEYIESISFTLRRHDWNFSAVEAPHVNEVKIKKVCLLHDIKTNTFKQIE